MSQRKRKKRERFTAEASTLGADDIGKTISIKKSLASGMISGYDLASGSSSQIDAAYQHLIDEEDRTGRIITYRPPPTVQKFYLSNADSISIMGPYGSAKTTGAVMKCLRHIFEQEPDKDGIRKTKIIAVRNTQKQLLDTTLDAWTKWVPPVIYDDDGTPYNIHTWNGQPRYIFTLGFADGEYTVDHPSGDGTKVYAQILFRALDKPAQERDLLSLEVTMAWLNEFREINAGLFGPLLGRRRRYPLEPNPKSPGGILRATWGGIIAEGNPPPHSGDWFKLFEQTEEGKRKLREVAEAHGVEPPTVEHFKQPSGLSDEAENIENLPGGKKYYIDMLAAAVLRGDATNSMDDPWARVHIHGEYGTHQTGAGVFSRFYSENEHVSPFKLQHLRGQPVVVAFDCGHLPAAMCMQLDYSIGQWRWYKEFVTEPRHARGFKQFMEAVTPQLVDRFGQDTEFVFVGDANGETGSEADITVSCFSIIRGMGYRVFGGEMSIEYRLGSVRAVLNRRHGLVIDPSCNIARQAMSGGFQYERKQKREEEYSDKPAKNFFSHLMDGCCHAMGWFEGPLLRGGDAYRPWPHSEASQEREQMIEDHHRRKMAEQGMGETVDPRFM